MRFLNQLCFNAIQFLFPKLCLICGRPGVTLCLACAQRRLDPYWVQQCHVCRQISRKGLVHADCADSTYLDGLLVGFYYNDTVERLVADIKYRFAFSGVVDLAYLLWLQLSPELRLLSGCTLTFVPTSRYRKKWRGFNQAELLCRELAKLSGYNYSELLEKPDNTSTQVHHNRVQRMQNLRQAFLLKSDATGLISCHDGPILIVDDISTTGSTLEMCAKVLKTVTRRPIIGVVFARGS